MSCLFLTTNKCSECSAVNIAYLPSMSELSEYCMTSSHKKCPFYCAKETNGSFDLTDLHLWRLGNVH